MSSRYDFNNIASEYDSWYDTDTGGEYDHLEKAMMLEMMGDARVPHLGKLLDIGCGTGHWTIFFKGLGYLVEGIDTSKNMLEIARSKDLSIPFLEGDGCNLPHTDEQFDIVSLITVLEFSTEPVSLLMESFRVLRSGGALIIGSLNRNSELATALRENPMAPYDRASLLSLEEVEKAMTKAGYIEIQIKSGCKIGNSNPFIENGDFLVAIGKKE